MRVIYCRASSLSSWMIRALTWSRWSHAAIVVDETTVIDATFWGRGVRERPLLELMEEHDDFVAVTYDLPDEVAAQAFLQRQLGKPYDWTAVLGFLMKRDIADEDSWFCNELFEGAAVAGGLQRWMGRLNRITPGMSHANRYGVIHVQP